MRCIQEKYSDDKNYDKREKTNIYDGKKKEKIIIMKMNENNNNYNNKNSYNNKNNNNTITITVIKTKLKSIWKSFCLSYFNACYWVLDGEWVGMKGDVFLWERLPSTVLTVTYYWVACITCITCISMCMCW